MAECVVFCFSVNVDGGFHKQGDPNVGESIS